MAWMVLLAGMRTSARQAADEQLADLARAPVGLAALELDDGPLDRLGQLVGVAHGPAGPVGQPLEPMVLVTIEDLVAGLARDAEVATDLAHRLAVEDAGHELQALVDHRTLLPGHRPLP
jgi:hypothetical protein